MKIIQDFDLTNYNSYRIKATCAKAYLPESEQDIIELFTNYDHFKPVIIGGGYNIILSKDAYENDFLIFSDNLSGFRVEGDRIIAQAGVSMLALSIAARDHSLSGLEIFYDIPSSLGGAIVMNAGAGGEEIKDMLVRVKYFDPATTQVHVIERKDISFEYRNSTFQKNPDLIIIEAELKLTPGDYETINQKMETTKAARWAKQPKEYPNAGSVFKRPPGRYVGPMIEELGLKGYSLGGAQVSQKHAGFIINVNNATGRDILDLIDMIRSRVKNAFGVELEVEQRVI